LINWDTGGYKPSEIEVVASFVVNKRNFGKPIDEQFLQSQTVQLFSRKIFLNMMIK